METVQPDEVPAEGGPLTDEDKQAFFTNFKKPEQVDRRGEKFIKAAENAAQNAEK